MPNRIGGKRYKKHGRKHRGPPEQKRVRQAGTGEQYAKVVRENGGGTADVLCNDGVTRLLIIRKKFRGRNRRDNHIKIHTVVLVGIREWEVVGPKKKSKVDLLEVYTDSDVVQLQKIGDINSSLLPEKDFGGGTDADIYTNEPESNPAKGESSAGENNKISLGDDLDWDDI